MEGKKSESLKENADLAPATVQKKLKLQKLFQSIVFLSFFFFIHVQILKDIRHYYFWLILQYQFNREESEEIYHIGFFFNGLSSFFCGNFHFVKCTNKQRRDGVLKDEYLLRISLDRRANRA